MVTIVHIDVRVVWVWHGVLRRYYSASCMTDRLAALELLADEDSSARAEALQHFYDTYRNQPLAMLNWLYVQVIQTANPPENIAAMRIGTLLGP